MEGMTMDAAFEVIDAFVDGERVDRPALERALADPAGRSYFIDVWLIREGVQEEMASIAAPPSAALPAAARRPWLSSLAASVLGLAIGYGAGAWWPPGASAPPAPAPPAVVTVAPQPAVPAPTRVIRLELGSDWKEGSGGG
jgi:hypothetical protein